MTPEQWRQVEALYHAAAARPLGERTAWLAEACADADLRGEVEWLLAQQASKAGALDQAAWEAGATHMAHDPAKPGLAPGTMLGPYRIEGPLGSGGMGEVFRAVDTRLGRVVAIKISNEQFSERSEREARAISALNHPRICILYDVGPNYLVMELVEGESLATRLERGKLSLSDTLEYGGQIAGALAAAHSKGIAHRDLKPQNIMIAKSGIKVLDFGLAKSVGDQTLTASHAVMGTPAYMAPEQWAGRGADHRSDIYALGLILGEMATGKRGSTDGLTGQFGYIVHRCLAEDAEERWQSAVDIRAQLEWLQRSPSVPSTQQRRVPYAWGAVAILAAAIGAVVANRFPGASRPSLPPSAPARFDLSLDYESGGFVILPEPSPDGRFLVYMSQSPGEKPVLRVRALGDAESRSLPGTEDARTPFWSADSQWIGFVVDGKIKKIAPTGGAVQTIATVTGGFQQPTWGSRGDILFRSSNREPLSLISESGGAPQLVTQLDTSRTENSHRGQQFLPDGRRFLFTARCADRAMNALYLGSLDTKTTKRLMPIDSEAHYISQGANQGLLLYQRDGALVARRLDLDREEVQGEPFAVLDRIGYGPSGLGVSLAASADGRVAVIKNVNRELANLVWYSRSGERQGNLGEPGEWAQVRISPDGTKVAASGPDRQTGNRDVFIFDLRGIPFQLTTNGANDWYPVWSPDSKRILFTSDRNEGGGFIKLAASASASEEPGFPGAGPEDWSQDNRWIIGSNNRGAWISEAKPGAKTTALPLAARGFTDGVTLSPDGRWIAYVSNESGPAEVYVRGFQGPGVSPDAIQVSRGGGDFPVWNAAGGELLFASADSTLWSFNTAGLDRGEVSEPVRLFRPCESSSLPFSPTSRSTFMRPYDTRDGKRFLITCTVEPPGRFSVLLNWPFSPKEQP